MKDSKPLTIYKKYTLALQEVRNLSEDIYILRLENRPFAFLPGQYILLGFPGETEKREYSIYSAADKPYLEVLIREVERGDLSRRFRKITPGTSLEVEGPFGFFTLESDPGLQLRYLFIASGTGISPFHSMVSTAPDMNYTLLHGIRVIEDHCEPDDYDPEKLVLCTSRDPHGTFHGRVTEWIKQHTIDPETEVFLCGNSAMIHDAIDLLTEKGHSLGKMHSEVYF